MCKHKALSRIRVRQEKEAELINRQRKSVDLLHDKVLALLTSHILMSPLNCHMALSALVSSFHPHHTFAKLVTWDKSHMCTRPYIKVAVAWLEAQILAAVLMLASVSGV